MLEKRVTVINQLGLHARAAAQLVRLAAGFDSKIIVRRRDTNVFADAKSILSILTLAASRGTELDIEIAGSDETAALCAVENLFISGFGEI